MGSDSDPDEITVASLATMSSPPPQPVAENLHPDSPHQDAEVEAGPEPAVKKAKKERRLQPNDYRPPAGNETELKSDLLEFGFGAKTVKSLMAKRELITDSTMQRPHGQTRENRENERKGVVAGSAKAKKERGVRKSGQEKYEGLVLSEGSNWVLFDPLRDFPMHFGDVPAFMQRYTHYKSGNARILEYNLESQSVRMKATPDALLGMKVEYTKAGPKMSEKRGPGRPKKLGRGCAAAARGGRKRVPAKVQETSSEIEADDASSSVSDLTDVEMDDGMQVEVADSQDC